MSHALQSYHWGPLQPGKGWGSTRFYIAHRPARTLIVLVHGFLSKSDKTWPDTDFLMIRDDIFDEADIVLWDYNSTTGNIPSEVNNLRKAIDATWVLGPQIVQRQLRRLKVDSPPSRSYERLILVGYSLGGYLVRACALRASRDVTPPGWIAELRLALFAPAHLGARIIGAFRTDGGILDGVKKWFRRNTARAADVLVARSRYLTTLKRRTETLHAAGKVTLAARTILFGSDESVVFVGGFTCDPAEVRSAGRHHGNVQRSNDTYQAPVDTLEALLP